MLMKKQLSQEKADHLEEATMVSEPEVNSEKDLKTEVEIATEATAIEAVQTTEDLIIEILTAEMQASAIVTTINQVLLDNKPKQKRL